MNQFWLIRHALVDRNSLPYLYGTEDVPVCAQTMQMQTENYALLASRLPRPARFVCTPLSRTQLTADALERAGYPAQERLINPAFIEQDFGSLQGRPMSDFETQNRHPFWPISAAETPPGGESFVSLIERVGAGLEALCDSQNPPDTVIVCHGGTIRAACAYALNLSAHQALCLQIDNISLTRIVKTKHGWRVLSINEHPYIPLAAPALPQQPQTIKTGVPA